MTANEAQIQSEINLKARQLQEEKDALAKSVIEREALIAKREKWQKDCSTSIRQSIQYAIQCGKRSAEKTLHYHNGAGPYADSLYGDGFLLNSEYNVELKNVIAELNKDGYKTRVVGKTVEHDETGAYMNSGGECGSDRPYYTHDTVLSVEW